MKYIFITLVIAGSLIACRSSQSKMDNSTGASSKASAKGWTSLFDGKTLQGWHSYGKTDPGAAWSVQDGTIYLNPAIKGGGDLVSNEEYDNFDLKLEWKISPKGNSGILFYVHEDPAKFRNTYNSGPEMQVLDNDGHPDGKIIKHRTGDLYDLISSSSEPVKPVGEWNQVEIKSLNGKLDFYLNGVNIVSTTLWDDNWKQLLAGSKFKNMPGFGTFKKGHIALQHHGDEVWYRNIQIKKL